MTDFYSQDLADDENYFQWSAFMVESDGLVNEVKTAIPITTCTDADYDAFYPPTQNTRNKFDKIKSEKTALCLGQYDAEGNPIDFTIYGSTEAMPHRRLDISFMPCTPVVSRDPNVKCRIPDNSAGAYARKL